MNRRSKAIIVVAIALAAVLAVWLTLRPRVSSGANVSYVTRPVRYADVAASVSETGTVNPVTEVQVGSEVSGTIRTLSVDYNSIVYKGQVLMTLDPTTFQAAVDGAQANLRLAQANLASAQVNVDKMKALLDLANSTVQRDEPLATQGLINQSQMDTERTAAVTAQQDYLASQSSVKVAQAQVAVAQGQLEQAQYNLSKTVIRSPFDGIVMARNVSIGQTVASSLQTPTLFTLATNLTDMQVDTSVDEADVGSVRTGESAQITVTAYPNLSFSGTVKQVRVNPTTVQNVVTYDAVIAVHDTSGKLLPGMTAQVNIEVGKRSHVLVVPIAAVLYRPIAERAPSQGAASAFGGGFGAGVVQSSGGSPAGQPVAGAPGSPVALWLLRSGRPTPLQVVIGLSDGKNIEITGGGLAEGDLVIVAQYRGARRSFGGDTAGTASTSSVKGAEPAAPGAGAPGSASRKGAAGGARANRTRAGAARGYAAPGAEPPTPSPVTGEAGDGVSPTAPSP